VDTETSTSLCIDGQRGLSLSKYISVYHTRHTQHQSKQKTDPSGYHIIQSKKTLCKVFKQPANNIVLIKPCSGHIRNIHPFNIPSRIDVIVDTVRYRTVLNFAVISLTEPKTHQTTESQSCGPTGDDVHRGHHTTTQISQQLDYTTSINSVIRRLQ
jgi:hypothetical protein